MEETPDLFCSLCLLQFGKKSVFDLHLTLVHDKKVEIKTEIDIDFSETQVDKDNEGKKSSSRKKHIKIKNSR